MNLFYFLQVQLQNIFTLKYKYTALYIEIQILELAVPKTGDRGEAEKKK